MKIKQVALFIVMITLVFFVGFGIAEEAVSFQNVTVKKSAETVDMGDKSVKKIDEFIEFLQQLPNLKEVTMYGTKLKLANMDKLTQAFPDVTFGVTLRFSEHTVRNDETAFSTYHGSSDKAHHSEDFEVLKYCRNLQALDVGHNAISDLSFLRYFPHIKILILACNSVTDISVLAELKELEYLELFKNKISDLTPLSGLTNLKDLNICFNAVEDWTPLYSLTNLERLWMHKSSIYSSTQGKVLTDEVVEDLKEALPNTLVNSTSYSTRGGWREHPRYLDIRDMFRTGMYHEWTPITEQEEP